MSLQPFVFATVMLAAVSSAHAETRTFLLRNTSDGYGVDRCLATGAACGRMVANAYCKGQDFAEAVSFRKVDRTDVTATVQTAQGSDADAFVAIECGR